MVDVLTHNQAHTSPQEALLHYGVKGMKWGVRKDEKGGGNEKRAAKYQKKADRAQAQIDEIKALPKPRRKMTQRSRDNDAAELEQFRAEQQKAADDIRGGRKLTDAQRKVLIGAGIAGGILAAYGTYQFIDSGQANAAFNKAPWKKNDQLRKYDNPEDVFGGVVQQINPGFGGYGTKMNCRRCTFAYEMRRRGNDVQATKSNAGTGQTVGGMMNALTPGAKNKTGRYGMILQAMKEGDKEGGLLDTITKKGIWGEKQIGSEKDSAWMKLAPSQKSEAIFAALRKEPKGSRGELGVGWTMGGGHSMAYEVFKDKVVIFDAQSGKQYSSPDQFRDFAQILTGAGHTRLDNKKLNEDFLRRWLQNVD